MSTTDSVADCYGQQMRTLSVITAVHPAVAGHLHAAAASLTRQVLPENWRMEWVICVDSEDPEGQISNVDCPGVDVLIVNSGRRLGPGGCRNIAALNSTGGVLRNLDADDVLLPDAIRGDIEALSQFRWTTSEALDLLEDGTTVSFARTSTDQPMKIGEILRQWRAAPILDVHPATLAIETDLFWEAGGYAALPISEDVVLLSRANMIAAGIHRAAPSVLYRKWDGQITAQERSETWSLIRRRFTS